MLLRNNSNDPGVQISVPFGFEHAVSQDLTYQLWNKIPWEVFPSFRVKNRSSLRNTVSALFSQTGADTRRPINEITLWDWGMLVSALYKVALAGAVLGYQPPVRDLRWRLLSVRVDGLAYTQDVLRLTDLLARQAILIDSLDNVRRLLEEVYPAASEVYRDENGSVYVVADLPGLLDHYMTGQGLSFRELILRAFEQGTLKDNRHLQLGGEIVPEIESDVTPWWGQDPDWSTKKDTDTAMKDELPPIGQLLFKSIASYPSRKAIEGFWKQETAEICSVCGLHPQGPGDKALKRRVCDVCEERRLDRSQLWAMQPSQDTIWIDEVTDTNGRIAFVTGQLELTHWLDGTLVESLVLIPPSTTHSCVMKTPSFGRIHRVWSTSQQFWQTIQTEVFTDLLSDDRRRLLLWLDQIPDLDPFHVYDLDLGRTTLSVVWYPPQQDGSGGYLISVDNLGYTARQLGAENIIYDHPAAAAIWVEDYINNGLVTEFRQPVLSNPDVSVIERAQNLLAGRRLVRITYQDTAYSTALPILAEPRTFMALVPADKALDVVQAIKTKYEREMGKVRNRLPLHLGAVYFHRRTPLRAALDAGRRMLKQKPLGGDQLWTVAEKPQPQTDRQSIQPLAKETKHFDTWYPVKLTQGHRSLTWRIPAVMGDGKTRDNWYPYVFVKADRKGQAPTGRTLVFEGVRPVDKGAEPCWLVHAAELHAGDQVYFMPATFDFEWLDTSARRFTLAYDDAGKRYGRLARPYLLDQLDEIKQAWQWLQDHMSPTQIHALREIIETKRDMWFDVPEPSCANEHFYQFCRDTLTNAEWR